MNFINLLPVIQASLQLAWFPVFYALFLNYDKYHESVESSDRDKCIDL